MSIVVKLTDDPKVASVKFWLGPADHAEVVKESTYFGDVLSQHHPKETVTLAMNVLRNYGFFVDEG
jgi:hypothetical protein